MYEGVHAKTDIKIRILVQSDSICTVFVLLIVYCTRTVLTLKIWWWFILIEYLLRYRLEVSTGPKFPARPAKFFFGPARNQCIRKFVLYNVFEILQQNQYNYIKLHSYFPLVQLLYCPSTTVMYNVQLTNSDKNLA